MNKNQVKSRVAAVREYLNGIERPVSSVQGYEVVARALGVKNRHVLAGSYELETVTATAQEKPQSDAAVLILEETAAPLTRATLAALPNGVVNCVVPVPFDKLQDIEEFNDYVSERITGSSVGLTDIGYEAAQHYYGPDALALRITASLSEEVLDNDDDDADGDVPVSADAKLASEIDAAVAVRVRMTGGAWQTFKLVYKSGEGLRMLEAPDEFDNDDEPVFEYLDARLAVETEGTFVTVEELRGAKRSDEGYWVTSEGETYRFLSTFEF